MANVPEKSTYTQTVVTPPTPPSTTSKFDIDLMQDLIREISVKEIIEEPKLSQGFTAARSFFTGNSVLKTDTILNDLRFGQEVRVDIEKDQNPFGLFQKDQLTYRAVDECHDQIDLDCTVPCINTLPNFERITFRLDTEYAYGVRACDKNKDFYDFGYFTKQYTLSRAAEQFGRELDLWNLVIRNLIATPAETVDVRLAAKHATHYWANLGTVTAAARATVQEAYWYHVRSFQGITPSVFVTDEFVQELIKAQEDAFPYSGNTTIQRVNTFEQWNVPGFMLANAARDILGLPTNVSVVIMERSPWLTTATTEEGVTSYETQFPLWSEDATKQYVAILDPRVGYQVAKDGYHLVINPYDCDKLVRGMIDTEYVGSGITFPQYGMVLEYTAATYA